MKDSRPLSTTLREPVAFRYSGGGEVVMPSHSPREGGWLALCLVACARRSHVCLSMSIYLSTVLSLSLCRNRLVVCPDCGGTGHQSHSPRVVGQIVMMPWAYRIMLLKCAIMPIHYAGIMPPHTNEWGITAITAIFRAKTTA